MRAGVEVFGDSSSIIFDNLVGGLLCFIASRIVFGVNKKAGSIDERGISGHLKKTERAELSSHSGPFYRIIADRLSGHSWTILISGHCKKAIGIIQSLVKLSKTLQNLTFLEFSHSLDREFSQSIKRTLGNYPTLEKVGIGGHRSKAGTDKLYSMVARITRMVLEYLNF